MGVDMGVGKGVGDMVGFGSGHHFRLNPVWEYCWTYLLL
jgi:hypothetical protein